MLPASPAYGTSAKPRERLKGGDEYKTKPELAAEIIKELQESGFNIKKVVADKLSSL